MLKTRPIFTRVDCSISEAGGSISLSVSAYPLSGVVDSAYEL